MKNAVANICLFPLERIELTLFSFLPTLMQFHFGKKTVRVYGITVKRENNRMNKFSPFDKFQIDLNIQYNQ